MSEKPLSVTALTKYIKYKFDHDEHLKDLLIEGEISNFKHNVRGHFYFTLKDEKASISAIMFRSQANKVKFTPKDGMNVILRGYISVFEVAGSYQVYVQSMEETGLGNLYQAYLQLKEKLEKAGYFAAQHKKPLPKFPKQIAVLTSATGAAVRDIIHIINRRYPLVKILVYPTTVQGENAKHEIVENIHKAQANSDNDLIILGRGGGSIEDLWAFNEEIVAQAIFDCTVPIISAVGHETDFTIADFIADERAPTPSGAAEIAVPDQRNLLKDIEATINRMQEASERIIQAGKRDVKHFLERYILKDPMRLLQPHERAFEELYHRLSIAHPKKRLQDAFEKETQAKHQLNRNYQRFLELKNQHLRDCYNRLEAYNPKRLLEKGYSLTKKQGKIIKSINDVQTGDHLQMELKDGILYVDVTNIEEDTHE